MAKPTKFMVFDCETCSLNLALPDNKPWEWGWLITDGKEVLERHAHYLKWDNMIISPDAARITGYRKENTANGDDPKVILDKFNETFLNEDYYLIAHNGLRFDVYLHRIWTLACGRKHDWGFIERVIDTDAIAKGYKLNIKPTKPLINWQYRLSSVVQKGLKSSLSTMAKEFGVIVDDTKLHGANYDVELNWQVFQKLRYFTGI